MMKQEQPRLESLAARERQLMETIYRLGEASVSEVLENLPDPPTYSAVRAMLTILGQKGFLEFRREKNKYLYRPAIEKNAARQSMLRNLLDTFFAGKPTEAIAAMLDVAADDLDDDDFRDLKKMIESARKGGR